MSLRAPLRLRIRLQTLPPNRLPPATLLPTTTTIRSLTHLRQQPATTTPHRPTPLPLTKPLLSHPNPQPQRRVYSSSSTGRSPGDLIVEELQELYEIAKDEFEIATESTDSATIYAASDRESARDALNELIAVYTVYTRDGSFLARGQGEGRAEGQAEGEGEVNVDTEMDPEEVEDGVREEVQRRVGRRVRELVVAVEGLEERGRES
ncbi:hypothetical protein BO71DRAFT_402014, partial [Aspergillus ellipticus CBS 707.79]